MEDTLATILSVIGAVVVAGGGLAGIAYGIFRHLGVKWLDTKFEERLASYKHAQQKEIEELRFKISALLDRAVKLHQREFDVLPEAWSKLNDGYWKTLGITSALQRYPDLDRMTVQQLEEFLGKCDLAAWEKDELLRSDKRTDYYATRIFWHRLADAQSTVRESHVFLKKNGIFLEEALRANFLTLDTLLWEALVEQESNERYGIIPRTSAKNEALRTKGPSLLQELESLVHSRLWNAQRNAL